MDRKNYFLVTGMMRSGTTFVCNLLNSQDDTVCFSDYPTYLFNQSVQLGVKNIKAELNEKEKNVLLSYVKSEGIQKGISGFDRVQPNQFSTWLDLYFISLNLMGNGEKYLGCKKTNQIFYLDQLLEAGVKIVYVVRDPRDIILSSINRFSGFNLYNYLFSWGKNYKNIIDYQSNPNFLLCRFEDLLNEKRGTEIKRISDFLGVEINDELKEFSFRNGSLRYKDNSSFSDIDMLFDKKAMYRWKSKKYQETDVVKYVSTVLKDDIRHLGYDLIDTTSVDVKKMLLDFKQAEKKIVLIKRTKHLAKLLVDFWYRKSIF